MPRRIGTGGALFERDAARVLTAVGWDVVRSAGSHGPLDLMAHRVGVTLYIQAKRGGLRDIKIEAWNDLLERAMRQGAIPLLAVAGQRVTDVVFWRLIGPRETRKRAPWELWLPD